MSGLAWRGVKNKREGTGENMGKKRIEWASCIRIGSGGEQALVQPCKPTQIRVKLFLKVNPNTYIVSAIL
jgi:hypothetical protein